MSEQLNQILEPTEKIIWRGKINRGAILFYHIFTFLIIITAFLFASSKEIIEYTSNGVPKTVSGSTLGIIIFIIGTLVIILSLIANFIVEYAITEKRVVIKSGIIGTDFHSIYFNQIKNAKVTVGLVGKIFKVGTISIDTGKIKTVQSSGSNNHQPITRTEVAYDKLSLVDTPYEVYKYFQKTLSNREESLHSGRADKENNI